jgi:acyl-coenzyme A synthetase/AMP-(fatty) acid ligase
MDSVADNRPAPPCPADFNLARHILWANDAPPERPALISVGAQGAQTHTYGELRNSILGIASDLTSRGFQVGSRILLRIDDRPTFPVAFLGAIAGGYVPVITPSSWDRKTTTQVAQQVQPVAILHSTAVSLPEWACPIIDVSRIRHDDCKVSTPVASRRDDPAYITFTSGTSSAPLGVVHAHRAVWARGRMVEGWHGMTQTDRVFHAGAFNWSFTLGTGLLDPWSVGATALVRCPRTDLSLIPALAARHRATILAGAPGVFRKFLKSPLPPLPHMRHALAAGETLPESLRAKWREATGTDLVEAYGQTECSTFISGSAQRPAPAGSAGYAQPGRRIAIVGQDGPVPRGETGEIAIIADDPGVMLGYLSDPRRTSSRFRNEWFLTGDLGSMSDDGAITCLGRIDDVLTAGGFRISPIEIEDVMSQFPGVTEAAAVDEQVSGEAIIVALHYASPERLDEAAMAAHAEVRLAAYKRPRVFHHHTSLPRGAGGKLLRARLRAATDGKL